MNSSTLSLGGTDYDLLSSLDDSELEDLEEQGLQVSSKGKNLNLRVNDIFSPLEGLGLGITASTNLNIKGDLTDFIVGLGNDRDTVNINGDISGVEILTDQPVETVQGHDLLVVNGNITGSDNLEINQFALFGGNDTVRLLGEVDDSDFLLGAGNDSLVISDLAGNVYVGGEAGRDFIEFRNLSTDVIVQSGDGDDTVIFNGITGTNSQDASFAAVDLGSGNDVLSLNNGAYNADVNTGSGMDRLKLSGDFENTFFNLSGNLTSELDGDFVSVSAGSLFNHSFFSSDSIFGDTLVVGYRSILTETDINFGDGNDSIVFGSSSSFSDNYFMLGEGSDTLVFGSGSRFDNMTIDLGDDEDHDIVRFSDDYVGDIFIVGGNEGDVLWIGAQEFSFSDDSPYFDNKFTSQYS